MGAKLAAVGQIERHAVAAHVDRQEDAGKESRVGPDEVEKGHDGRCDKTGDERDEGHDARHAQGQRTHGHKAFVKLAAQTQPVAGEVVDGTERQTPVDESHDDGADRHATPLSQPPRHKRET